MKNKSSSQRMALHCNTSHSLADASACVFGATKRKRGACPYLSELGHCPTGARCGPMPPLLTAGLAGRHLSSFALGRVVQVICRWEMSVWALQGVLGARAGKGQHCSWGCGLWGWAKLSAALWWPSGGSCPCLESCRPQRADRCGECWRCPREPSMEPPLLLPSAALGDRGRCRRGGGGSAVGRLWKEMKT